LLIVATADVEQSMRSAIPAIDRSVAAKSSLIFSIVSVERCIPLLVIRTILDAIPGFEFHPPGSQTFLPISPLVRTTGLRLIRPTTAPACAPNKTDAAQTGEISLRIPLIVSGATCHHHRSMSPLVGTSQECSPP
jgi:hypothetical protein